MKKFVLYNGSGDLITFISGDSSLVVQDNYADVTDYPNVLDIQANIDLFKYDFASESVVAR